MNDQSIPLGKPRLGKAQRSDGPNEQKQPHNLALSNEAWKNLEAMSKEMGTGSVSRLVENIGMKKIDIQWASDAENKLNAEEKTKAWQAQKEEAANAFWAAQYLQCELDR